MCHCPAADPAGALFPPCCLRCPVVRLAISDYRTNVASYPAWQHWLREHQPPLQVIWGRYDPSLQVEDAEAYRRDVPGAEVRILDAGHFALDEQPDLIADLNRGFLQRHQARIDG